MRFVETSSADRVVEEDLDDLSEGLTLGEDVLGGDDAIVVLGQFEDHAAECSGAQLGSSLSADQASHGVEGALDVAVSVDHRRN